MARNVKICSTNLVEHRPCARHGAAAVKKTGSVTALVERAFYRLREEFVFVKTEYRQSVRHEAWLCSMRANRLDTSESRMFS